MRTLSSFKNVSVGILSQIIIGILGFYSRKVFIDSLGTEYLGINGLIDNVLSMLSLVESGIGVSIVYNLYKPLAENNKPKIIAFVQLYKKAYTVLAVVVLILSVILYPFLGSLMKGSESIPFISIAYFIFVAKNMVTYLNAHKVSLIYADQKGYVLARISFGFQVLTMLSRIIVLVLTHNYIIYLLIELLIYMLQSIVNAKIVNKRYPYIKTKEKYFIDLKEKESLIQNVKALFFHGIGGFCVFGTDNILIASFIGIATVGIYSNYTMIMGQIAAVLSPILSGVGASVGNLIAVEDNHKRYSVFKVIYLINFWIYSVSVIFLYILLEPIINWWLGHGLLLDRLTLVIILCNFYINGLRTSVLTFKMKGGIFVQDKYMPLIEAAINLAACLILVKYFGLSGIFLGTMISTLCTVFWTAPLLVYKNIFTIPVALYFKTYTFYAILTLITCCLTTYVCNLIVLDNNFTSLVVKGITCLVVPNLIFISIFYKFEEFQFIKQVVKNLLLKFKKIKLTSAG